MANGNWLYNIAFIVFAILYLPFFLLRGKYHKDISMRFGVLPKEILRALSGKTTIWVHAVSVGETQAAKPLIEVLKLKFPDTPIVFSTVTKTGNDLAKKLFKDASIIYLPFDISFIVNKVLNEINPGFMVILETEIWPNLINCCSAKDIPVFVVNGRISRGSFGRYRLAKPLLKSVLQRINLFCMQAEEDAERIKYLGASPDKIRITGNMKFDATVEEPGPADMSILKPKDGEKLLIAGSTHKGEDAVILRAFKNLGMQFPNLKLIIAPRHIERVSEIEKIAEGLGFKPIRFSRLTADYRVLILDQMGILNNLYNLASMVFIGGSLVPKGGHNIIEPASFGKAVLVGRYMFNFKDIVEKFIDKNAIVQVENHTLQSAIWDLLTNKDKLKALGERAKSVVAENKGANLRTVDYIGETLKRREYVADIDS
ncbi:MAG: 3-deoxy-D-manno-octulosonic acid transferase [Candidatus Omnitrophota bacterium]